MGFFDFLKKKEPLMERVSVEELPIWISSRRNSLRATEENLLSVLHHRISLLAKELAEKQAMIDKIDLNEKRVDSRSKFIIRQNLHNYSYYMGKLISSLNYLKEKETEKLIEKLNALFYDFEKKSTMSFEKATFIIGKELGEVRDTIDKFFNDVKIRLKDNEDFITNSKIISITEQKLLALNNQDNLKNDILKNISKIDDAINNLEESRQSNYKEIERIKRTVEFIVEMNHKEDLRKRKENYEKELYHLKEIIDFKQLASINHFSQKNMKIINDYRENFKDNYLYENGGRIISLIEDSKLMTEQIRNKIDELYKTKNLIDSSELPEIEQTKIKHHENDIKRLESGITTLREERLHESRKVEKFEANKSEIVDKIKDDLQLIQIELVR